MKSESFSESLDLLSLNPSTVKAELDYWEHLALSFGTDKHPGESMADNNTRNTRRSRSASQGFADAIGSGVVSNSFQTLSYCCSKLFHRWDI